MRAHPTPCRDPAAPPRWAGVWVCVTLLGGCMQTAGELARFESRPTDAQVSLPMPDAGPPPIQLCGCGDVQVQQALEVDGDLAVKGRIGAAGGLVVDGTLYSEADPLGTNTAIQLGALRQRWGVVHGADLTVLGDAHVGGELTVQGDLDVGGTIFLPDEAPISSADGQLHFRRDLTEPFAWPCSCDPDPGVDDAIDAPDPDQRPALGLPPDALANLQTDLDLTLPAGRYVFDAIGGPGALRVRVEGAVEWVIRGDVRVDGGLDVALADGASLRLLIAGTLSVSGSTSLGDPIRPEALTVHVRTGPSIAISEAFALSGRLLAPAVELGTSVPLDWRGAIVVGRISAAAGLRLRR